VSDDTAQTSAQNVISDGEVQEQTAGATAESPAVAADQPSSAAPVVTAGAPESDDDAGSDDAESDDAGSDEDESDDPESTLEGEAEIAADYLEELLDIADLDGDIDTYIEGDRAHVSIVSESEVLVGDRGEVLDALQELTRLAVMTETGDRSRLMLDVAGFRDRRRQQLVAEAEAAVEQARSSSQPVPLEPMNPFERKIVHDAVAAAGLSSESEGDEPRRHVVVQPQK
jgi:spoIIIJ-associated protein